MSSYTRIQPRLRFLALLAAVALAAPLATGQAVISNGPVDVTLTATSQAESITLSNVTPAAVTFSNLAPNAIVNGNAPISFTLSWSFNTQKTLEMWGYFDTATALSNLNATPVGILAYQVESTVTGTPGTLPAANSPFNASASAVNLGPPGSQGLKLVSVANTLSGSNNTYTLALRINLTGVNTVSAASTWTGTLHLRATTI